MRILELLFDTPETRTVATKGRNGTSKTSAHARPVSGFPAFSDVKTSGSDY